MATDLDVDAEAGTPTAAADEVVDVADVGPGPDVAPATAPAGRLPIHRLRDLTPRGRAVAAGFGLCLVLAHVVAVIQFAPDWMPGADVALMTIRSFDSLTSRVPLVGQPSTSGLYGGMQRHAFHPGPMQFYMAAPFVRLLGGTAGMLVISVFVTASSVLVTVWALFRQLGAYAAVVAAVVMSLVMFTTGSSTLFNPISSNISGYPLLCGAVLVYCLLCGDDRLLPLAVVVLSFAGQAHLAVGPSVGFLGVVAVVGLALTWWRAGIRRDAAVRRHALRWGGGSLGLGLVLWSPVIVQEFRGEPGNITVLVRFTSDGDRSQLGYGSALRQLGHALGLPPILGRWQFSGIDLIEPVPLMTWVSAVAVLAALAVAWARWRRTRPRQAHLVAMVPVLMPSGLVTGSSVPDSIEQVRRSFYHWVWPLTLFAVMALVLLATELARALAARRAQGGTPLQVPRSLPGVGVALAMAVMVVPTLVSPSMDRSTNTLLAAGSAYPRDTWTSLIDQVIDADIGDIDGKLVVVRKGPMLFDGTYEAVTLGLMERGYDMAFAPNARDYVADEHLARPGEVGAVLLLVIEGAAGPPAGLPEAPEVARTPTTPGVDLEAYEQVVEAAEAADPDAIVPGPEFEAVLESLPPEERRLVEVQVRELFRTPASSFLQPDVVDFFLDHPTADPELSAAALSRLADSLAGAGAPDPEAIAFSIRLVRGADADRSLGFSGAPTGD